MVFELTDDQQAWVLRTLGKLEAWADREERDRAAREERTRQFEATVTALHDTLMRPGEDGRTLVQDVREIVVDTKEAARARTRAVSIVQAVILMSPAVAGAVAIWKGWLIAAVDMAAWFRK